MERCIGHLHLWNHSQNTHYKIGNNSYFFIANFKIAVYTGAKKGKICKKRGFFSKIFPREKAARCCVYMTGWHIEFRA